MQIHCGLERETVPHEAPRGLFSLAGSGAEPGPRGVPTSLPSNARAMARSRLSFSAGDTCAILASPRTAHSLAEKRSHKTRSHGQDAKSRLCDLNTGVSNVTLSDGLRLHRPAASALRAEHGSLSAGTCGLRGLPRRVLPVPPKCHFTS